MGKHKRKNKKISAIWFFIVALAIFALTWTSFFGVSNWYGDTEKVYVKSAEDIRWGIDIKGGVEAVFSPETDGEVTDKQLEEAKTIIEMRLMGKNIADYEISVDTKNDQVVVKFPWSSDETDFDAQSAIDELGNMAVLTFCYGSTYDKDKIILTGSEHVSNASATYENGSPVVALTLNSKGTKLFADATAKAYASGDQIAICLDEEVKSAPTVNAHITNGQAVISGDFTYEEAEDLANTINAGSLPFGLSVDDSKLQVISPTLGNEALQVMIVAGVIAFALVCVLMILRYRLPGVIASIALLGQVSGMIATVSGYFGGIDSFTLTIPGIAGIILSIGMGVDANVITSERVRDELKGGRTIQSAIYTGSKNALSAIFDGNITVIIVSVVLMGAFGPSDSFFAKLLSPVMGMFGSAVSGAVYSFGYTLLMGVVFNFIMGVFCSNVMLKSIIRFKWARKSWLFGGAKNEEA
ncbi:MAG: SecD/SecF family protein translocase subunit [Acutalibacteraceae bacterium]|nr:SecD/SecF family protein translocase subunit [Acutalibacteraceae bacterium]